MTSLRIVRFRATLLFGAALACLIALPAAARGEEGVWSKHAVPIPLHQPFRILSPDRTKTVFTEGSTLSVIESGSRSSGLEGYSLLGLGELVWSPDSKAFTITASEGGQDGPWFVTVFTLQYGRVTLNEPFGEVLTRMHERYACLGQEDPNLGMVRWVRESKTLVVAGEVPPASSCADKGAVRGFLVDLASGKVIYEFDGPKLKEEFGDHLGKRPAVDLAGRPPAR